MVRTSDSARYPPASRNSSSARAKRATSRSRRGFLDAEPELLDAQDRLVEPPPGQDVREAGGVDAGPARMGVLREVADAGGMRHHPGRGGGLARDDLEHRGLAGAVAADEPDGVAGVQAEARRRPTRTLPPTSTLRPRTDSMPTIVSAPTPEPRTVAPGPRRSVAAGLLDYPGVTRSVTCGARTQRAERGARCTWPITPSSSTRTSCRCRSGSTTSRRT